MSEKLAFPSSKFTPSKSLLIWSGSTCPRILATYSLSILEEGCINLLASSPLLVNSIKPEVLISSLPTDIHFPLLILGKARNTEGRPSGSLVEEISPTFLLYIKTLKGLAPSEISTVFPSISIKS